MTTMCVADYHEVSPMPAFKPGSYRAVKDAINERCRAYKLSAEQSRQCADHGAWCYRHGQSASAAIREGVMMARKLRDNAQMLPTGPRPAA